jgi:hypothetical protein
MKTNMIAVWVFIAMVVCIISFFIGKHYSSFPPETVKELEKFTNQMTPLLANDEARTKEQLTFLIKVLKTLDAGDNTSAKKELIERLGRYYYNYTYENERHMNSETTESLLKTMESLSVSSKSFSSVVKFKPEE